MSVPRLCGFDVNGWIDFAARNWSVLPGGEEEIGRTTINPGGLLGSVVCVGSDRDKHWIGGPPADLAPHGLGIGWGDVGKRDRRLSVRRLLEGAETHREALGAAFSGIARGARFSVIAIDEGYGEADQERLLDALAAARLSNTMLVWRSVLAVLSHLEVHDVPNGTRIGVVSQAGQGFTVQSLRVLRAGGRTGTVLAPERRRAATIVPSCFGYQNLVSTARRVILESGGQGDPTVHRALARSVGRLAFGHPISPEVLRNERGDWEILEPPQAIELPDEVPSTEAFAAVSGCEVILFESVVSGQVHAAALTACEQATGRKVTVLPRDAVAKGALFAARRLSLGEPVFFDFLPMISTIVFSAGEASNYDLINAEETLEAGRFYRSPHPAKLALPPGQAKLSVYLRKEAEAWPRKAEIDIGNSIEAPVPVSLWVEQKPAAGRARILLEARALDRQFAVDWETANIIEKNWEEVIEDLATPPPSMPNRLVLECGMHAWESSDRGPGLMELLTANIDRPQPDWEALANRLSSRPYQKYCISSDGEIPQEIPENVQLQLQTLTDRAIEETEDRVANRRIAENGALKFLTWQFRRCPDCVGDLLLDCIEQEHLPIFSHPFINHQSHPILVYQGAARVIGDKIQERRLLSAILNRRMTSWRWRVETACLAILLSRSLAAPRLLERAELDKMARRIVFEFRDNLRTDYTKFHYAPFLLAGLLRYRQRESHAFVVGLEELADRIYLAMDDVIEDLERKRPRSPRFERASRKYLPIMKDLQAELEGQGSNPDLLMDIYNAA